MTVKYEVALVAAVQTVLATAMEGVSITKFGALPNMMNGYVAFGGTIAGAEGSLFDVPFTMAMDKSEWQLNVVAYGPVVAEYAPVAEGIQAAYEAWDAARVEFWNDVKKTNKVQNLLGYMAADDETFDKAAIARHLKCEVASLVKGQIVAFANDKGEIVEGAFQRANRDGSVEVRVGNIIHSLTTPVDRNQVFDTVVDIKDAKKAADGEAAAEVKAPAPRAGGKKIVNG